MRTPGGVSNVRIVVEGGQPLQGKLLVPSELTGRRPGVLFVHGWGDSQRRNVGTARALVDLGCVCLTFNLRGHGRTRVDIDTVTRADNLLDTFAAYDLLAGQPHVDPTRIGVVGSSYGGYLAILASLERPIRFLALCVPAIYQDADFDRPKRELNLDPSLSAYRRRRLTPAQNRALASASKFEGDVLIVESERDEVIPSQVIVNYRDAFTGAASLVHEVLRDADHGLSREDWRRAYGALLLDWFRRRLGVSETAPAISAMAENG
jgi:pimeloyl-ACP methyl ester carboxylesterase